MRASWPLLALSLLLCHCHTVIGYNDFDEVVGGQGGAGGAAGKAGAGLSGNSGQSGAAAAGQAGAGGEGQGGSSGSGGSTGGGASGQGGQAGGAGSGGNAGNAGSAGESGQGGEAGAGAGGEAGAGAGGAGAGGAGAGGSAGLGGDSGQGGEAGVSGGGPGGAGSSGQGGAGASGAGASGAGQGGAGGSVGSPTISTVSVVRCNTKEAVPGKPLPQLPQGGSACVRVSGSGLASVTSATMGDLQMSEPQGVVSDSEVTFGLVVPHGAAEGGRSLQLFEAAKPVGEAKDALAVTALTVSMFGDDEAGLGTPSSAWGTLQRAFGVAKAGDTIRLLSDLDLQSSVLVELPQGVTLDGAGHILDGAGMTLGKGIFRAKAQSSLINLTLTKFADSALLIDEGLVTMVDVVLQANRQGISLGGTGRLYARGTKPETCRFELHEAFGIYIYNGPNNPEQVVLEQCELRNNSAGVWGEFGAGIKLTGCLVENNGLVQQNGGVVVQINSFLSATDTVFKNNMPASIVSRPIVNSDGTLLGNKTISVQGGSIHGGTLGMWIRAAADVHVSDVLIEGAAEVACKVESPSKVVIEGTKPDACVMQKTGLAALYGGNFYGSPTIEVTNCTMRDSFEGAVITGNTKLTLTDVTLRGNNRKGTPGPEGLRVHDQAEVTMLGGAIFDNAHGGVAVLGGASVSLSGVDLHHNGSGWPDGSWLGHGIHALSATTTLTLTDCKAHDHAKGAGLMLEQAGTVSVSKSTFFTNVSGVRDERQASGLALLDTTFADHTREALFSSNSAGSLSVSGCGFSANNAGADASLADVVLGRDGSGPAASFSKASFDGQAYSGAGTVCGSAADVVIAGKTRLRNDGAGCIAW